MVQFRALRSAHSELPRDIALKGDDLLAAIGGHPEFAVERRMFSASAAERAARERCEALLLVPRGEHDARAAPAEAARDRSHSQPQATASPTV
jgi:hypothetical protein